MRDVECKKCGETYHTAGNVVIITCPKCNPEDRSILSLRIDERVEEEARNHPEGLHPEGVKILLYRGAVLALEEWMKLKEEKSL